ncbi:hypothetical protein Bca52824_022542 [Brassica carinata]|uniref:Uncharacterized protein n=1 Tax=Brassica carinata TaxID=52824 RepID=A0A8X7VGH7_BRACI|nr:hypothetical protein Bca52824_022542 [Brassica carinata]
MEGKGRVGSSSSSSSFTAELYGFKDPLPPSSSSGIFSSIFPHPSTGVARDGPSSKHGSQGQTEKNFLLICSLSTLLSLFKSSSCFSKLQLCKKTELIHVI